MSSIPSQSSPIPGHLPILDLFFPGLGYFSSLVHQVFSGDLNSYAVVLCVFGVFTFLAKYMSELFHWVQSNLTSTVYISSSNEAYDMVLLWMKTANIGNTSRYTIARVGTPTKLPGLTSGTKKKPLNFSPWNGSFFFRYNYSVILFRSTLKDTPFRQEEEVSLTCLGRSPRPIHELLNECQKEYIRQTDDKTTIFKHNGTYWSRATTVVAKPLSSVMLEDRQKRSLTRDIETFLLDRTRQWHAARSLPYRRGFMFHGPPGTGKSSLSLAVAGQFDLDIYTVNLMTADNEGLESLFSQLPPKCIVLVEDVDAADATGRRDTKNAPGGIRKGITLSTLLNTLDGVSSQEGRILIMTTNHIEKLDKALIRPGRIDQVIPFHLADADILRQLYCLVFNQTIYEVKDQTERSRINAEVEHRGTEFSTKIPHRRLTPAEVLSFLLPLRDCPTKALNEAQEWAARTIHDKEKDARKEIVVGKDEVCFYQRAKCLICHPILFFALPLLSCIMGAVLYYL